jgi:DNA-binding CsgD family transcriptional regulator
VLASLEHVIGRLERAETRRDLHEITHELRDHYKIAHVVYHWVNSAGEQYGAGTYPVEWAMHYVQQGYMRIDPVIQAAYSKFHPIEWRRLDWSSKAAKTILAEAKSFGIGNQGYSVPVRGPAGQFALLTANQTCSDSEWDEFTQGHQRELIIIAHMFHERALAFEKREGDGPARQLSPREADALTYLALGYSRAQVADTLNISEHTLRVYVESARSKLGAMNTTHAIVKAMTQGLIAVSAT